MQVNTWITPTNMKKKISLIAAFIFINSCGLSPGMHMDTKSSWVDETKYVYISAIDKTVKLISISETQDLTYKNNY